MYHSSFEYDGVFGFLDFRLPLCSTKLWLGYCSTPLIWTTIQEPVGQGNSLCPCRWFTVFRRTCCTCSGSTWPSVRSTGQRSTAHACPEELTSWRENMTWSRKWTKKSPAYRKNRTLRWARWPQMYNLHKPWWTNLLNFHRPINGHLHGRNCQDCLINSEVKIFCIHTWFNKIVFIFLTLFWLCIMFDFNFSLQTQKMMVSQPF